ncbi:hypothetical protein Rsub_04612 [Raphidocelis subcapitata]|uniref:SWIM-type domain-containing protein n=1 Tax=Raphidocelis subcapitata TaxID=307507 RepID=A0A2V0NXZ6_9CHLO|nr:hypothetical protein Rsub_04612 [Raphidocelis subcapitata]|eukprot:GBF92508.1 hypothetical protein Rsub_04612 [Raphidocelis subcapitata]
MPPRKRVARAVELEDGTWDWSDEEREEPVAAKPKQKKAAGASGRGVSGGGGGGGSGSGSGASGRGASGRGASGGGRGGRGGSGSGSAKATPPKAKRAKKEAPEKRTSPSGSTVRYAAAPSKPVQDRIKRALPGSGHRMFLISTRELRPAGAPGGRAQEFTVLGATGNVYAVSISRNPTCDCPDHGKGNLCKHVLFVLLRALKLRANNPLVWQKALLTQEVEDILAGVHSTGSDVRDVLAGEAVRRGLQAATGRAKPGTRRAVEGDCPICFDELVDGAEAVSWCASCGNNLHTRCCDSWARARRAGGGGVTCVYCRAPWADGSRPGAAGGGGAGAGAAGPPGGGAYVNLARYSEAHRGVDTSIEALYPETAGFITGAWGRHGR